MAELQSSVVTVRVQKTEGSWERPKRRLHIQLLLGRGAMVCVSLREEFMKNIKLIHRKKLCKIVLDLFVSLSFSLYLNIDKVRFCKQLDTWGMDGEVLQVILPSEEEVSKLVSTSEKQYKERLG